LAAGIDPTKADEKTIKKIKDSLLRLHKILEEIPPGAKEKEKRLDALYSSVTGLLLNLRAHQNVFGEKPSFVPHGSLPIYKNDLEETARILKDLELVHKGYFKALRAKEDTTRSLGLARKQRLGLNARLKSRREDVLTRFGTIGTSIEIADKAIRPKRKQLESKIDRFKAAIQRQCGLELRDFLDCLETMSFTSSEGPQAAAMGISQTGKLIDKGVNYLTDAAGDSVKKQYVIHQLDLLGRDVTDLTEAWKIGRDMQIQLDDPNAYKLLMEKQDFDRLCDRFLNLEGFDYAAQSNDPDVKVAKEAKDAMDGYVAAIQHRNEEVMAYNGAIAALADVEGQIEGIELQEKQIQAAINANTDPELPIMTTYVDILYEQAKELCLRELYCANRALTFWSLQDFDVFGHLLGESDPGQITHEMIEAGQLEITKRLEAAFESLARPMQKFPTENKRRGLKILLNDKTAPDVIADLKDRNVAEFSLEPGKPPAHAVFAGLANIRITRVRPWVKGMKSNNKIHHIIITHMGKESIVRPDGHIMEFSHTPVPTTFLYNAKKGLGKWKSIEEDGTIVETEGDKTFAQIGPFTRWRIGIYPNHNNNLDLSGLEEIILEFHGGNHTIDP
jgi:hypothetical protein